MNQDLLECSVLSLLIGWLGVFRGLSRVAEWLLCPTFHLLQNPGLYLNQSFHHLGYIEHTYPGDDDVGDRTSDLRDGSSIYTHNFQRHLWRGIQAGGAY
ncbi:hypothetical protein HZ326_2226 [Fusarium oxysporum f. sp. albedinis]|nr:hypothetical protein HZ326_2226 [Fusarium oxysporum f. sp. albedinis]